MQNYKLAIYLIITLLFATATSKTSFAQTQSAKQKAQSELSRRGEIYFKFNLNDIKDTRGFTKAISIDKIQDNNVYAYANSKGWEDFLSNGLDFEVLTAPSELFEVAMTDDYRQVLETWNYYPTYEAFVSLMQNFANNYPNICKIINLETLPSQRKLIGVRISDNVGVPEDEPEVLLTSTMHGDETTGYVLLLHLIDYLLTNYNSDTRITEMVNNFDIVIFPLANPDGTYRGGNNSVNGATRFNANNVDLNRNYPDPKDGPHPDGNAWQPETVAFMRLADENQFTIATNFHGGAEVLNYPWDTWSQKTADDSWWVYTSRRYVDTVHKYSPANYMNSFNNGITNGYQWYSINGGRQDYMNYFQNCRECTLEISDVKLVPASQLIAHWDYNYRSVLNYIEDAGYGLRGLVTDSITGAPVKAKVTIVGHDNNNSHVYSNTQVGDYHRLLKKGNYTVSFTALGYKEKTFNVSINDLQTTILDVQLYNGTPVANFVCDTNITHIDGNVKFQNNSAGNNISSINWYFEGGNPATSTENAPVINYQKPGKYSVKLVIKSSFLSDSVIKEDFITVEPFYISKNATYTLTCGSEDYYFCDTGGPDANYSDNESFETTFKVNSDTTAIYLEFEDFDLEESANCINDNLSIYYNDDPANDLGTFCGTNSPQMPKGYKSVTVKFNSNGDINSKGWKAKIVCTSTVSNKALDEINLTKIYPNPVSSNIINLESEFVMKYVTIYNCDGRYVLGFKPETNIYILNHNLKPGMYFVKIETTKGVETQKIIVVK